MIPQAAGIRAALDRQATLIRETLGTRPDGAVLMVGAFGFLNDGTDPRAVARDLLDTIGEAELWFVDASRRSGYRGRILDTAVRSQTGGARRAIDVPGLLRHSGWIVLDLERSDLTSLSFPFTQMVRGRAKARSTSGSDTPSGV
ncbi:MAG: hypothetical protein GY929_16790 [Actinomycetia bacterium]|nr:hypothetical protein [Actinomycetes bacterium]